jgi:hypothetical protein
MNVRIKKAALPSLLLLAIACTMASGQTSMPVPKITDLFSPDETKKAGLSKLNPEEIAALNAVFFRVLVAMNSTSETHATTRRSSVSDSGDLILRTTPI